VQRFRKIARRYDITRIPDSAGKDAVASMVEDILAAPTLTSDDRTEVLTIKEAYEGTWASNSMAPSLEALGSRAPVPAKEWKFHAAQLTYNCTEGEWASGDIGVLRGLFDRFITFAQALGVKLSTTGLSATMERSKKEHVHLHLYFHSGTLFHKRGVGALDVFTFEAISPHVVPNKASGGAFAGAVRHGHFYVVADKVGTVFNWTDFEPFVAYAVEAWWLDNLLKHEKLNHKAYLSYAARVGVGFQRRLGDIQAAGRYMKEQAMRDLVEEEQEALANSMLPMKSFPEVEQFLAHFRGQPRFRRPILAIVGGTNLGKSMLAADVLRRVGAIVGPSEFLEITVELNEHLDFADFDCRRHAGIILDGVGDALILKMNREALQGRPKLCKGGQSATNMYSYSYTLAKRAVVATFDLSAQNLDALEKDHWLMNERNVIRLILKEKAWVEPEPVLARPQPELLPTEDHVARKRRLASSSPVLGNVPQISSSSDTLRAPPHLPYLGATP